MAKYCPIQERKVVYLQCLDCEFYGKCDNISKDMKSKNNKRKSEGIGNEENA